MNIGSRVKNWFKRNVTIDPWYFLFRPNNVATGEFLGEEDALKVSTVFRCVSVLSQGVSTIPLVLKRKISEGYEPAINHPLFNLFMFKPNNFQDSVMFWEQIMISLTLRGNAYIQKVITNGGVVVQLIPMLTDYVRVKGDSSNLTYEYRPPLTNEVYILTPDQVLHIRAMPKNGIVGISPLDKAMEAVGMALASEKFGAAFFANGVTPSGVLEHPGSLTQEAHNRLKDDFNRKQSDSDKKHSTMILEEGVKWTAMGLTNEQAQFIATREFTVFDICRWFGVPPHLVQVADRQTGPSIEQLGLEFLTHSLRPWLVRIEKALLTQLFPEKDWPNYEIEFLADALLRADNTGRSTYYNAGLNNGWLSIDEVRERESLNPLPNGLGKTYFRPLNMYTLGETPTQPTGAPSTTSGNSGYAPGTPAAQGKIPEGTGQSPRSKINDFFPVVEYTLERIERRAKKVRENGKGDWSKFDEDTYRDIKPLTGSISHLIDVVFDEKAFADTLISDIKESKPILGAYFRSIEQLFNKQESAAP